jgi:hypothetical protein
VRRFRCQEVSGEPGSRVECWVQVLRVMMMSAMDVGARYLELVLRFRRLAPSLVDSYVGCAEFAA